MSAPPALPPNPPSPGPPRRRWFGRVLGCLVLAILLLCCVPLGGLAWVVRNADQRSHREERETVDRLVRDLFANGDANLVFDRADERFRNAHARTELAEFFRNHPELVAADNLTLAPTLTSKVAGQDCYKVILTFAHSTQTLTVYYLLIGAEMVLLGLEPGLDRAVPAEIKSLTAPPETRRTSRRHRWRRWFD